MAETSFPAANLTLPDTSAYFPAWIVHLLARLILFLRRHNLAAGHRRAPGVPSWFRSRPALLLDPAQTLAASVRGVFAHAIGWMRHRRGSDLGHRGWPALAATVATLGGKLHGSRAGLQSHGLRRGNPSLVVPGKIRMKAATSVTNATAMLLSAKNDFAAPPPALNVAPAPAASAACHGGSLRPVMAGECRDHARHDRQRHSDAGCRGDVNLSFAED